MEEIKKPSVSEFKNVFEQDTVKKMIDEVNKNKSILAVVNEKNIMDDIILFMKSISTQMPIVYVTLRSRKEDIESAVEKHQLNPKRMFYIDVAGDKVTDAKNTISIMKPNDLNSLSIAIMNYSKEIKGEMFLIFDSIPTLFIYNSPETSLRFIHSILAKLSDTEVKSVFITTPDNLESNKDLYAFFKKAIFI